MSFHEGKLAFFPWIHAIAGTHIMHCVSLLISDHSAKLLLLWLCPVHLLLDTLSWEMLQVSGLRAALVPFSIGGGPTSRFLVLLSLAFMWLRTAFCF